MAFNVNFYVFSKRERSTAVPSGSGLSVSCHANEELDILAPVIVLDWRQEQAIPTGYNYARISDFGRWYWITGWRNEGGVWIASLQVDALASWAQALGAQNLYVYRSSAISDGTVIDSRYPATAYVVISSVNFDSGMVGVNDVDTMFYCVGLIGKTTGTYYRYFTPPQLRALITGILSDGFYEAILGEFGATEYPEAKVAINPLQYLTSVRAYPYVLIQDAAASTGLVIANVSVPNAECYVPNDSIFTKVIDIDISSLRHPQQGRGMWVNVAHASYTLQMPGWGLIPLPASRMAEYTHLQLTITIDTTTGDALLRGSFYSPNDDVTVYSGEIFQLSTRLGIDVPVSQVIVGGYSAVSAVRDLLPAVAGGVASVAMGNPLGAVSALSSASAAIGNAVAAQTPHVNQIPHQGSLASFNGLQASIVAEFTLLADDDNSGQGRPLCTIRQLSTIPGFIMADAEELSLPCTTAELETIKAAVAGGFWYGV